MSEDDRDHWDDRYRKLFDGDGAEPAAPQAPKLFADHLELFPDRGSALELACGDGSLSLWLARRGIDVLGVDVSPVAIEAARTAAHRHGLSDRCRFEVVDLDDGLPDSPPMDVIVCHLYHNPALYGPLIERLSPGGMLAVAVLSEVGSGPGRYRAEPGELRRSFGDHLTVLLDREGSGTAVLIGRLAGRADDAGTGT